MVTPRILYELGRPHGQLRIHKLVIALDEARPLVILGHGNRSDTEVFDRTVRCVGFALQNAGVGIVRLLDLAYDNRLQLAARGFEIKICLADVSMNHGKEDMGRHYLVQVVLFIDLPLQLAVHGQS